MKKLVEITEVIDEKMIDEGLLMMRSDGILHLDVNLNHEVNLPNAINTFQEKNEITKGLYYANLFTVDKLLIPDKETRDFIASEKRNEFVLADAFVIHSLPQRLIANFYLQFERPPRPTKFFNNKEDAIAWLLTFVPEDWLELYKAK